MIVLDTNIVSEFSRPRMNANVLRWFEASDFGSLYLCSVVIMEQIYGADRILRQSGSDRYHRVLGRLIEERFDNRILEWTIADAERTGQIHARRDAIGRPMGVQDAMIAAICLSHGASPATRNTKDVEGLDLRLVNPFEVG
ncbi:type II toxin-antitoxin system VapC family toxin [Rhizobium straminoryzae]|uniref:type II toxin-antitoxin system VapC family toxin n=1 Tax=Rhizobium straminoryzae TaxID=1387186 RepID=UPI00163DDC36